MADEKEIENLFASRFSDFEAPVPEAAWDNIQSRVAQKKRRGVVVWIRWAAAASVVLVGSLIALQLLNSEEQSALYSKRTSPVLFEYEIVSGNSASVAESNQSKSGESKPNKEATAAPIKNALAEETNDSEKSLAEKNSSKEEKESRENGQKQLEERVQFETPEPLRHPEHEITQENAGTQLDSAQQNSLATDSVKSNPSPALTEEELLSKINPPMPPLDDEKPRQSNNQEASWLLAANLQSGSSAGGASKVESFTLTGGGRMDGAGLESVDDNTGFSNQAANQLIVDQTDYLPPVVFGLLVGRSFSEQWGIDAGLSYSILGSTTDYLNGLTGTNRLHYLGVPISVRRSFGAGKNVGWYLSSGYMPEISLGGTIRNSSPDVPIEQIRDYGGQHSLFLGAGVNARINKLFTLYAQPSYSYYFKHHNNPYNFRIGRRWWPSIQLGLRMQLK